MFNARFRGAERSRWLLGVLAGIGISIAATQLVMSAMAQPSQDAPRAVPAIAGPVSFADVVDVVSPAVVNVAVEMRTQMMPTGLPNMRGPNGESPFDDFFGRFFGFPGQPGAPTERHSQALGSGFIVDPEGYVVTNNHVVESAENVVVILQGGEKLDAEIVGRDEKTDLAVLKVDAGRRLPFVAFGNSDSARVGDWVLAIGNPFGLGGSATAGIISARGRDIQSGPYDDYLQIDAPINSGNSGGPVFNGAGEVIGVNTAIYSPNGGNVGIGFAIPAKQAQNVVAALKESGTVTRGWLGVQIQSIDEDLAEALGADDGQGALVAEVSPDSPAARGGLLAGDVIRSVDGESIEDPRELSRVIAGTRPGSRVELGIVRDGRSKSVDIQIGNLETTAAVSDGDRKSGGRESLAGLTLQELTPATREQLGLADDATGVVVESVDPGSAAAEKGVMPGDVITQINQKSVRSTADARSALEAARRDSERALMVLRRGDTQRYVAVPLS